MRTLRLSLVGAVILALLGGVGSAALAQDEEPTTPAAVTCEKTWDESTLRLGQSRAEGRARLTFRIEFDYGSSDPRLVGRGTQQTTRDEFAYEHPSVEATTMVIENDEGTWQGEATQYSTADELGEMALLRGSGAYEGLTALLFIRSTPEGDGELCSGLIFEGDLPPMPDPVEPPGE